MFSECRCGFVLRPRWWHLVVSCVFCLRLVPRRGHRWASNNWWWVVVKTNHSASFSSQAIRALADCHSKVSSFAANGGFSILNTEDMLQIGSSMTTLFMIAYFISFKIFFFKPFFLFVLFRFFLFLLFLILLFNFFCPLLLKQKSRRHRDASSEYDVEALLRQEITFAVKRGNIFIISKRQNSNKRLKCGFVVRSDVSAHHSSFRT